MTAAITLAVILSLTPSPAPTYAYEFSPSCRNRTATSHHAPTYIRVFRTHLHRVDRVPTSLYVGRVMASGASPSYKPMAVLRAMSVAIRQYAWWESLRGHRTGWGQCFDIRDGGWGQYYTAAHVSDRLRSALGSTETASLRKGGRLFRSGWRGGSGRDGWHLYDDTMTRLARRGVTTLGLLRHQLSPVDIRGVR